MSLDTIELIMAIETEFGMDIPNHDAAKLETVGKISTYIQLRLENDRGPPLNEIEAAAHWERVNTIVVEQLVVEPQRVTRAAHLVFDL